MINIIKYKLIIFFIILTCTSVYANQDWQDLFENENKLYGSEKEEKFPINSFFIEKEAWQGHHSLMVFWFYKSIDYPRYTSLRFFPFYYSLESKIDNRSKMILYLPFPYYRKIEGDKRFAVDILGYSYTDKDSEDFSLLYLYYSGLNRKENSSYKGLFPVFYYSAVCSGLKNSRNIISPLFWYRSEKIYNYEKSLLADKSVIVSPLYVNIDNRYSDQKQSDELTFFPIIPLIYFSYIEKNSAHRDFLSIFYWKTGDKGLEKIYNPFFLWKDESYLHIPLALCFNWQNESGEKGHINPFFFSFQDKEGSINGFPVIPFLAYSNENRKYTRKTYLSLFSWQTDSSGKLDSVANPFFFWKDESYLHIPLALSFNWQNESGEKSHINPLFFSFQDKEGSINGFPVIPFLAYSNENRKYTRKTYLSLFSWQTDSSGRLDSIANPFFFWKDESYLHIPLALSFNWQNKSGERSHINPLFFSFQDKEGSINGFPVIPFLAYSNENREYTRKTYLSLFSWKRDNTGNLQSIASPFVWWKKDSYLHFPVVLSFNWENDEEKLQLNPLFFNYQSGDELVSGFPFIPVIAYTNKNRRYTRKTFLSVISWKRDKHGELESISSPLVWHRRNRYLMILPFYYTTLSENDNPETEEGFSLSPIHYHSYSPQKNILWAGPYYSNDDKLTGNYNTLFFPLYYAWKTDNSEGSVFLPFSFNYEDKKSSYSLNLLGISKSRSFGMVPAGFGTGRINDTWYVDVEFSWLYNMFSLSKRIPLKTENPSPDDGNDYENDDSFRLSEAETRKRLENPLIHEKREMTRENSLSFWGINLFYGLFSMEKADSKRHFRLLPLAWITWDKNSEDKVLFIPGLFFNYRQADESYFVFAPLIIPLYGSQRQGDSYKKGYVLNLYWDEYDAEKDYHEHTILWPFINWYHSPRKSGGRFFPVFWYKSWQQDGYQYTRAISPIWYKKSRYSMDNPYDRSEFNISPFKFKYITSRNNSYQSISWYPIIPVYTVYETEREISKRFLYSFYSLYKNYEQKYMETDFLFGIGHSEKTYLSSDFSQNSLLKEKAWLFPVSIVENEYDPVSRKIVKHDATLLWPFFNYYYSEKERGHRVFPVYWYKEWQDEYYKHNRFISPLILSYNHTYHSLANPNNNYNLFVNPLTFRYSKQHGNRYTRIYGLPVIPFFYSYESEKEVSTRVFYALVNHYENKTTHFQSTNLCCGLLHWDARYRNGDYTESNILESNSRFLIIWNISKRYSHTRPDKLIAYDYNILWPIFNVRRSEKAQGWRVFPVIWRESQIKNNKKINSTLLPLLLTYHKNSSSLDGSRCFKSLTINPLWMASDDKQKEKGFFTSPLTLGLVYHGWDNEYSNWLIGPFYHSSDKEKKVSRTLFVPFYYNYNSPEEKTRFFMGYYSYRSPFYKRTNFLYLVDFKSYRKNGDRGDEYNFLLGTLSYKSHQNYKRYKALWGLLYDYKGYRNSYNYKVDFLTFLYRQERREKYFHSSFIPLWWYTKTDNYTRLIATPLYYQYEDRRQFQQIVGLGTLWYRNLNKKNNDDFRLGLGGLAYYGRSKKERGYQYHGIGLWGLLYEREYETANNYKESAFLKFVYKRIETDDYVKTRILGITVSKRKKCAPGLVAQGEI